ncbi:MAG: hypothetical protein IPJ41_10345 [Phycisphaerales bacterium]|nr:hypothetical protein [Phycisphaerales bacterium]
MVEDTRLQQIKEGAGLEESRLNVEFIEFLRKWSTPVLLVLALISLGYFAWNKQKEARAARVDDAFAQLNQSTETASPSPDALKRIAEDFKNVRGVQIMATLAAADEYLRSVQRGVKPGATINQQGEAENADDILTDEDRTRFLGEAESLYKEVYGLTDGRPGLAIHRLSALYGLAAVSESRKDATAAKNMLDQAATLANNNGFLEQAAIIQARLSALNSIDKPVTIYAKADLPEIPALKPPEPEAPAVNPEDQTVGPVPAQEGGAPPATSDESAPASGSDGNPRRRPAETRSSPVATARAAPPARGALAAGDERGPAGAGSPGRRNGARLGRR